MPTNGENLINNQPNYPSPGKKERKTETGGKGSEVHGKSILVHRGLILG